VRQLGDAPELQAKRECARNCEGEAVAGICIATTANIGKIVVAGTNNKAAFIPTDKGAGPQGTAPFFASVVDGTAP
jgi:hypothetical protein